MPTRKELEERVEREVRIMLAEGDQTYLNGLSDEALLEALESELYFLGLYPDEDHETPEIIRDLLRRRFEEWRQKPDLRVQLEESSVAWMPSSRAVGSLRAKQYFVFGSAQEPMLSQEPIPTTENSRLLPAERAWVLDFPPSESQDSGGMPSQ